MLISAQVKPTWAREPLLRAPSHPSREFLLHPGPYTQQCSAEMSGNEGQPLGNATLPFFSCSDTLLDEAN